MLDDNCPHDAPEVFATTAAAVGAVVDGTALITLLGGVAGPAALNGLLAFPRPAAATACGVTGATAAAGDMAGEMETGARAASGAGAGAADADLAFALKNVAVPFTVVFWFMHGLVMMYVARDAVQGAPDAATAFPELRAWPANRVAAWQTAAG